MRALWDEFHELGTEMIVTKVQTKNDFIDRNFFTEFHRVLEKVYEKIDIASFKKPLEYFLLNGLLHVSVIIVFYNIIR
jgi:hypothetical protein